LVEFFLVFFFPNLPGASILTEFVSFAFSFFLPFGAFCGFPPVVLAMFFFFFCWYQFSFSVWEVFSSVFFSGVFFSCGGRRLGLGGQGFFGFGVPFF